ncbi:prophage protein (plasmid) [Limosilactobacillus reuteri I5007]|uniref:Prophage protein n=1 Tax=Limosilactobacillus reuteri I5007 TaxID=1340495 RepID=R9WK51_LIMRT|nr:pyocin knob domain-containing protein [Limosilactobacillus reuteri]AGO00212.1 prophage protein [Limosilactobacillus reuteri I5007]
MAENNQLSDETKNNSTDTSSTDASSAVIGNHENAVVPHKISNHDKLVQTMVMVDGEWINVNDTNDQANMKEDVHKVNKKVVEAQKGIVEAKNTADSAVKYADSAVSASKVNSDAIAAQSSAISEAKAAADDAASKAQFIKENASSEAAAIRNQVADVANNVSSVKADVASATSDVANLKVDVQANSAAIIKTNEAVSVQSKSSSDAINELKIANGQVESIAKDAKNNATVAKQTADAATIVAQDAKSNAVVAKQTASSATIEATNATSTASKAELSVNGLTTRVDGIEGDTKKLSGRVTSTETILQQTKDQLLQKADKSVVDQANNLISQLSAEQKTMAGQISQKVSSSEYQTLKDKVNNLRIGGRNLIPNSGTDIVIESKTTDPYPAWNNKAIYWNLTPGETYTFSVSATNTNGVEQASVRIFKSILDGKYINKEAAHWYFNADGKRRSFTFTTPNDAIPYDIWLYAGPMGTLQGKNFTTTYHHPQLELGNIESDYSPNPDDAIASIKKNSTAIDENSKAIKLKADATEVNNLKGTVNSHSASINLFSDQLKSMVTESKVNDIINGKGFATQNTVQSLIDQKSNTISESIVKLSNDVRNNGGGINLLRSTDVFSKAYWIYDNIENQHKDSLVELGKVGTADSRIYQRLSIETTEHVFSVSFDAQISDDCTDTDVIVSCGPYDALQNVHVSGKDLKHYKVENWTWAGTSNNFSLYVRNGKIRLSKLKLEYGPVATPYAPAPSDNASVNQLQSVTASIDGLQSAVKNKVDQSQYTQLAGVVQTKVSQSDFNRLDNQVNVQTLDNANIDNMKTTGHYFVHNLTGNPLGGWVYVDVTGNANDRIRQDVYQDSGTKHAFRRWFGTYWTGWSTGAEESEITQLRNDINLRVKSGDLLSQINIAAGHTLIQSNKIYFDADSFVMSPNSKAFIPSAYITNINADKINTGTLHSITINNGNGTFRVDPDGNVYANSMHVNNGSIYQGTVLGADVYSISNLTSNSLDEVNDATQDWVKLKDGIIELHGANGDHYSSIVPIDVITTYSGDGGSTEVHHGLGILDSREVIIGSASLDSEHSNRITHSRNFSVISRTHLGITNSYIQAQLDPDVEYGKGARFSIQKDNKVGFYVGEGENGNQVNVQFAGDGSGFNVHGNFNVYGAKNSAVKTSQGDVAVSAYETAEYYFGDIGEGQTGDSGIAFVGIEKLFSETVNTSIPYQVFITAYGPGNVWVEQRKQDRFMIKSSQPNIKFGWEIKAKRRGYENTRLQKVN